MCNGCLEVQICCWNKWMNVMKIPHQEIEGINGLLPYLSFTPSSLPLLFSSLSLLLFLLFVLLSFFSCGPLITRLRERIQRSPEIEPDPHSHPCLPAIVPAHLHHDHQHWDHLIIIIVVQLSPSFFYLVLSTLTSHLSVYYSFFCSNCGERGMGREGKF